MLSGNTFQVYKVSTRASRASTDHTNRDLAYKLIANNKVIPLDSWPKDGADISKNAEKAKVKGASKVKVTGAVFI